MWYTASIEKGSYQLCMCVMLGDWACDAKDVVHGQVCVCVCVRARAPVPVSACLFCHRVLGKFIYVIIDSSDIIILPRSTVIIY